MRRAQAQISYKYRKMYHLSHKKRLVIKIKFRNLLFQIKLRNKKKNQMKLFLTRFLKLKKIKRYSTYYLVKKKPH